MTAVRALLLFLGFIGYHFWPLIDEIYWIWSQYMYKQIGSKRTLAAICWWNFQVTWFHICKHRHFDSELLTDCCWFRNSDALSRSLLQSKLWGLTVQSHRHWLVGREAAIYYASGDLMRKISECHICERLGHRTWFWIEDAQTQGNIVLRAIIVILSGSNERRRAFSRRNFCFGHISQCADA